MLSPEFPDRAAPIRFPKISFKSKSLPSGPKNSLNLLSMVTARSWLYCTGDTQYGFKSGIKRDIASLTKIMTAMCAIQISKNYNISPKTTYFKITEWSASIIGTTANLQENTWMTVEDLLYALMLPSGNDAASVLSENLGAVLYFDRTGNKSLIAEIRSIDLTEDQESVRLYVQEFVNYMNTKGRKLGMVRSRFANPHGLDHPNNYSCCQDILLMIKEAVQNQTFRKVVKSVSYKGTFKIFREGKVMCKSMNWTNTNRLLEKADICGIKTGITTKAGGCLATLVQLSSNTDAYIVVLGSSSAQARFKDTLKILNWIYEQLAMPNAD